MTIAAEIFRAYDIRGIVDATLTSDAVYNIGKAFGSKVISEGGNKVVIGRDGRLSGPSIEESLINGITATGCDVVTIGIIPTPILYYASVYLRIPAAIMITGSHNPPNYNGLKMIINDQAIYGQQIQELYEIVTSGEFAKGSGSIETIDVVDSYVKAVVESSTEHHPMKVVVDAGNGVAGKIAPALLRALGHEVIELYCDVDGTFPNHHPDPGDPNNLQSIIATVTKEGADIGLAFDGDGDRLGVIDNKGKIIWPDRVLMSFAENILKNDANRTVIYDIKSTGDLQHIVTNSGGIPLIWKTGHSLIKAKMRETNAVLAGEMSGHFFIADRWFGFDDGIYAAARLLELLSEEHCSAHELFARYPENFSTPEIPVAVSEEEKFHIIEQLIANAKFDNATNITTLDGLRVDFDDSWGLVRASNTTANLIIRFEGKSKQSLASVQAKFKDLLHKVAPNLSLPF